MSKQPLSPAAQAVLDAFRTSHTGQGCLAAALHAAVDQVVPATVVVLVAVIAFVAVLLKSVITLWTTR